MPTLGESGDLGEGHGGELLHTLHQPTKISSPETSAVTCLFRVYNTLLNFQQHIMH